MQDFTKRRSRGSQLLRAALGCAAMLVLGLVVVVASRAAWGMYGKFAEAATARSQSQEQLEELQARYETVNAQVRALTSERGVEAAVRARWGLVRPGEHEIDIVRQSTTTAAAPDDKNILDRLWDLLFVW